jgi:hypothetical protein
LSRPSDRRAGTFGSEASGDRANTKAAVVPVKPVPPRPVGVGEGVMAPRCPVAARKHGYCGGVGRFARREICDSTAMI